MHQFKKYKCRNAFHCVAGSLQYLLGGMTGSILGLHIATYVVYKFRNIGFLPIHVFLPLWHRIRNISQESKAKWRNGPLCILPPAGAQEKGGIGKSASSEHDVSDFNPGIDSSEKLLDQISIQERELLYLHESPSSIGEPPLSLPSLFRWTPDAWPIGGSRWIRIIRMTLPFLHAREDRMDKYNGSGRKKEKGRPLDKIPSRGPGPIFQHWGKRLCACAAAPFLC